uniref:Uncharacterized protein n=1 Tax=viral metagenome TaxID=1070528 RepID=A0A6C0AFB2_9ZZZZ
MNFFLNFYKFKMKRTHKEDEIVEYVKNNEILYNSINTCLYLSELEINNDISEKELLKKLTKIITKSFKFFPELNLEKNKTKKYYNNKKILKLLVISGDFVDGKLNYDNAAFGLFKDSLTLFMENFLYKYNFEDKYIKFKIKNKEIFFYEDDDQDTSDEDITQNLEKIKLK